MMEDTQKQMVFELRREPRAGGTAGELYLNDEKVARAVFSRERSDEHMMRILMRMYLGVGA